MFFQISELFVFSHDPAYGGIWHAHPMACAICGAQHGQSGLRDRFQ